MLFSKSQFYELLLYPVPMLIKWGKSSVSSTHIDRIKIFVSRTCLIHLLFEGKSTIDSINNKFFSKGGGTILAIFSPARRKIPPSGCCRRGLELSKKKNFPWDPENFLENPENSENHSAALRRSHKRCMVIHDFRALKIALGPLKKIYKKLIFRL